MKFRLLFNSLFIVWLFVFTFSSFAQLPKAGDCGESCFETYIQNVNETPDGCLKYTLRVTNNGSCGHALSHYTVGIPCGTISQLSNTGGWKQEIGITDPRTGLTGFKIDDIIGFGEDGAAGEFMVEFTICPTADCTTQLDCWAPEVAYKAGQCIFYEQTEISCNKLAAHLVTQDVSCFGGSDGMAEVVIESGEAPFTYVWSNAATGPINKDITTGEYTVEITDNNGEHVVLTAVIDQPEKMQAVLDISPASCSGSADGSASVEVSGGAPPYTYSWSHGSTGDQLQNLDAGYYNITVSDSKGCSIEVPVVVEQGVTISLTGTVEKTSCSASTGSIDLTVSGGAAPYTYTWTNGATSEDINALPGGVYSVQVRDVNGCQAAKTFFVREDNPMQLSAVTTNTACVEDNSGSIDLTVTNGVAPYTFTWSDGQTTEDISGLAKGMYTVLVKDQNGCEASLQVSVVTQTFQVSTSTQNPSCHGEDDGSIQITPVQGEPPYSYSWSTGSTSQNLDNLAGGLYDVTITDGSGCARKLYFFLTDPSELSASANVENINCVEGGFNVDLNVSGGTAPYSYVWSDGSTTKDLDSLTSGSYTVDITDANGCTTTQSFIIDANSAGCTELTNPDDQTDDEGTDDGSDDGSDEDTPGDGDEGDPGEDDGNTGGEDDGGDEDTPGDGDDSGDNDDEPGDLPDDNNGACSEPFETEIELISVEGTCYTYKASVEYNGDHSYGLSHYSVEIPCGTVEDVTNSEHWKVAFGTDPTTGLKGFKIDDISNFGEGDWPEEFSVHFTVCATDESCLSTLSEMDYAVAYKYGQCVTTETVGTTGADPSVTLLAYPNPFSESTTIEFSNLPEGYTTVDIYNHYGILVKQLFADFTKKGVVYSVLLDGSDLPNDTYMYRINTPSQVYTGKLMLIKR